MKAFYIFSMLAMFSGSSQAQLLDFGGMYGYRFENGRKIPYNNPVIGQPGCPIGYNAHHVHSASQVDWDIIACARPFNRAVPPVAVFGGLYSTDSTGRLFENPMAQSGNNCPRGFQSAQIHGNRTPRDNPLFLCYRNFRDGRGGGPYQFFEFGGLISHFEQAAGNYVTGGSSCPSGFQQSQAVYGEVGVDWGIYLCLENSFRIE